MKYLFLSIGHPSRQREHVTLSPKGTTYKLRRAVMTEIKL